MTSHILVVDDEEAFRYSTAKILERAGFEVAVAEDYRTALVRLESDEPLDLLISDVVMPNRVNGFALARMAQMRRRGLKVLYVTSYDLPTIEAEGKVLRKPICEEDLVREVRAILAGSSEHLT
ncbi:MAG TPA: response regulator [Stellaceae bacterium]|nr:response regulator [Stellaceae bacterium]